uniref:PX domain-containing protein n=1 Tax=Peronospora matthiolae TaxID=2874970 RepID=A0AAV1VEG2_9STRA
MSKVDDCIEDEVPAVRSASTFDTSSTSIDTSSSSSRKTRQKLMRFEPSSCSLASEIILLRELKLVPVKLYPLQLSRAMHVRLFLSRIEWIAIHEVLERDEGVVYYVLNVYQKCQQKGLPATAARNRSTRQVRSYKTLPDSEPETRRPDYQIEQRYSSFARLRSNVASAARKYHPKCRVCTYCVSVLDFLHTSPSRPNLKVKFTTQPDERKAILSSFINQLVQVVRDDYLSCPRTLKRGFPRDSSPCPAVSSGTNW